MKIRVIVAAFSNGKHQEPIIKRLFDGVKVFARKLELIPQYKAINEYYKAYREQEQDLVKELIQRHVRAINQDKEPADHVTIEQFKAVPPDLMPEYYQRNNEYLDTEVKLDIKFTPQEVEDFNPDLSELLLIEPFLPDSIAELMQFEPKTGQIQKK